MSQQDTEKNAFHHFIMHSSQLIEHTDDCFCANKSQHIFKQSDLKFGLLHQSGNSHETSETRELLK